MNMATTTTNLSLTKPAGEESGSVLVINDNSDKIDAAFGRNNLFLSIANLSSLPHTVSNSKITANHRVVNAIFSNTAAAPSDWSYSTAAGSVTLSGTISGTTNVYLCLAEFY